MRPIHLAATAVAVSALFGGCASIGTHSMVWIGAEDRPELVEWTIDESYEVADTLTIGVETENGAIVIERGGTGNEVRVHASVRSLPEHEGEVMIGAEFDRATGTLTLGPVWPEGKPAHGKNGTESMAFTVTVPHGLPVERVSLKRGNGALSCVGLGGEGGFITGNGAIEVEGHDGPVKARTGNGAVTVSGRVGSAEIKTGNGAIHLEHTGGPVTLETGNGAIDIRCAPSFAGDLEASSGHGAITVVLADGQNGRVEYANVHGAVSMMGERVGRGSGPKSGRFSVGTGEGPTIRLRTTSGAIEVR